MSTVFNLSQARKVFNSISITHLCDASEEVRVVSGGIRSFASKPKMLGKALTVKTDGDLLSVIQGLQIATSEHVLVIESGGSPFALAGELFATEAKRKNIAGIVVDGFCRDAPLVQEIGIPFYARGTCPKAGSKMKKGELNGGISCGGVSISPEDLVLGDEEGLVVISEKSFPAILEKAVGISRMEDTILEKMHGGMGLVEVLKELIPDLGEKIEGK